MLVCGAMLVVAITALRRAQSQLPSLHFAAHDWVYAMYLLWLGAGLAWSVASAQTLVLTVFLAVTWAATVSLAFHPVTSTIRTMFRFSLLVAAASLVLLPIAPELALQPDVPTGHTELRGIIDHQLRLGMLMCMTIGLVALAIANGQSKVLRGSWPAAVYIFAIGLLVVVLFMSRARGATGAFALALMLCGLVSPNRAIMLASAVCLGLLGLTLSLFLQPLLDLILQNPSDATLSGRTLLWPKVLELAERRPFVGYGFGSFYQPIFETYWRNYRPPSAHNSLLQAYFESGLVGFGLVALLSATVVASGVYISLVMRRISYTLFAGLFVVLTGLVDTIIAGKLTILTTVMLLVAAQEANELRERQRRYAGGAAIA